MADARPTWRRAFDGVDQRVSPRIEELVRTEQFADVAAVVTQVQLQFQRRTERALRQGWHFWNLPAGSDVKRLSDQVASLERRVRDLSKQIEELEAGDAGDGQGGTGGRRPQPR